MFCAKALGCHDGLYGRTGPRAKTVSVQLAAVARWLRIPSWIVSAHLLCFFLAACDSKLSAGEWSCGANPDAGTDFGDIVANLGEAVRIPWGTGFERDFCDYARARGFCYVAADGKYSVVSTEAHNGAFSAAFNVTADNSGQSQARCVRQGVLPQSAYYSAWYFFPERAASSGNWNLFHFQGGQPNHNLWDVSVNTAANGDLSLYASDLQDGVKEYGRGAKAPLIPIGSWFEVGVFWRRAADATGEFSVYQDGHRILQLTDLITDDTTWVSGTSGIWRRF